MLQAHFVVFLPQPYNQPFLQGTPIPYIREWCLETEIRVMGMLIATGMSLLPGPLIGQS